MLPTMNKIIMRYIQYDKYIKVAVAVIMWYSAGIATVTSY